MVNNAVDEILKENIENNMSTKVDSNEYDEDDTLEDIGDDP